MSMTPLKDFNHYFNLCKRHKVRVENLLATDKMHLLIQGVKDIFERHGDLSKINLLEEKSNLSRDAIIEIYTLGRFIELLYMDEVKKRTH